MQRSGSVVINALSQGQYVSDDEFRNLWTSDQDRFETQILDWIAEGVERDGTLSTSGWGGIIRQYLSPDEIETVYNYVKTNVARLEPEWRDSFAATFEISTNALPPPEEGDCLMYYGMMILNALARREKDTAIELVSQAKTTGADPSKIYYTSDELREQSFEFEGNPSELTLKELASILGYDALADALS